MVKKPLNVSYEAIIYAAFIIAVLLARRIALVSPDITDFLWSYGLWGVFFMMLGSISYRSAEKEKGVVFSSSFAFGLIVGIFLWTLYALNEMRSEHHAFSITILLGIILFAILEALVSVVITVAMTFVIRRVRGWRS